MKTENKKLLREVLEAVFCGLVLLSPLILQAVSEFIRK